MKKIKLITSYLNWKAGEVIEQDDQKSKELVSLKRAEYVDTPKKVEAQKQVEQEETQTKVMEPKKRGRKKKYETK